MTGVSAMTALAQQVTATVRQAAARTGSDFSYLLAQAKLESGLDPTAAATTSSARGLFQFTNATWLAMVRRHGAEHGLGWAADAINSGAAGAGSAVRGAILSLRSNAEAASLMAGEFAHDNARSLEHRLGRAVDATELYLAHFLGAGGASKFLGAMASAPAAAAASLMPAAARANPGIFYARDGSPRSLAEVHDHFARRLAASGAIPASGGNTLPVAGETLPVLASTNANTTANANRVELARLLLAELGG